MYKRLIREFPFSSQQALLFADFGRTKHEARESRAPRSLLACHRSPEKRENTNARSRASSLAVHN